MIYRKVDITMAATYLVSEEMAKEFIDHRILKKSPLTQRAFDRAMKQAVKCQELGISSDEAIQITIDKGWTGIDFNYIQNYLIRNNRHENGNQGNSGNQRQTRSSRADEQFRNITSGTYPTTRQ